jgi:hypothetical protein
MSQKTSEARYKIYDINSNSEVVSDFTCDIGSIVKSNTWFDLALLNAFKPRS